MHQDETLEFASGRSDSQAHSDRERVTLPASPLQVTCFFEADLGAKLVVRAFAEGVGTLLLMLAIVSAGIVTQRVAHSDALLGLALSAATIAGTLVSLIVAFGAVSGGHFNPLITGLQWLAGERSSGCAAAYIAAQLVGGVFGVLLAGVVHGTSPALPLSGSPMFSLLASEMIASAALMTIVFGCARSNRTQAGPFAVGAWLAAAIVVSPSGSYANPAVALASIIAVGPIHLPVKLAGSFVAAEIAGALLALAIICVIYPRSSDTQWSR